MGCIERFAPGTSHATYYNMGMDKKDALPTLFFDGQASLEAWLKDHHADSKGIWLKMAKKDTGIPSVDHATALESALCYGWIDGQGAALDDQYWLVRFTPRRPKSKWSKVNCDKVERLIAAGRMQPAGQQQVDQAKADGRWEAAYDSQSKIGIPEDFQRALDQNPQAQDFFKTLNSANRYAFLYRLQTTKNPALRAAKVQKFIEMLLKQEKFH